MERREEEEGDVNGLYQRLSGGEIKRSVREKSLCAMTRKGKRLSSVRRSFSSLNFSSD